jgi:peroxiredoxin
VKQLKAVTEKENITWRSFVDPGNAGAGPIAAKWNMSATPTFYLIDHKGVIRYKWAGPPGEKVMDAAIEKLVHAAEADGKKPQ